MLSILFSLNKLLLSAKSGLKKFLVNHCWKWESVIWDKPRLESDVFIHQNTELVNTILYSPVSMHSSSESKIGVPNSKKNP